MRIELPGSRVGEKLHPIDSMDFTCAAITSSHLVKVMNGNFHAGRDFGNLKFMEAPVLDFDFVTVDYSAREFSVLVRSVTAIVNSRV